MVTPRPIKSYRSLATKWYYQMVVDECINDYYWLENNKNKILINIPVILLLLMLMLIE